MPKYLLQKLFFVLIIFMLDSATSSELSTLINLSQFQFDDHFNSTGDNLSLDFSLLGIQYFSAMGSERTFQQKAEFATLYKKSFSSYDFGLDAFVGSYSSARSSYFSVAELYGGVHSEDEKSYLYVGRKVQHLSYLDENLNIGLYNPFFSDDYIQFRTLGLVGIHTQAQFSIFGIDASYLPFYFPNQDPQFYEENGELKSPSRWAKKPPKELQFGSQNRAIVYAIRDYSTNDIIKNGGYTLSTFLGLSDARPWLRVSVARKPVCEIPLSRDSYGTAINFTGQNKILPTVTYSQTRSVDINADFGITKTTLSYLGDQPENNAVAENETLQFLRPLNIYGVSVSADLSKWLGHNLQTEVSYSEINGGEITDLMADGNPSPLTFSSQRTLFKRPVSLGVRSDFYIFAANPVITSLKWTYDSYYKGSLLTGHFRYQALKNTNVKFGFDLLGVEAETPSTDHFLKTNQANDRVYGGLDYVF